MTTTLQLPWRTPPLGALTGDFAFPGKGDAEGPRAPRLPTPMGNISSAAGVPSVPVDKVALNERSMGALDASTRVGQPMPFGSALVPAVGAASPTAPATAGPASFLPAPAAPPIGATAGRGTLYADSAAAAPAVDLGSTGVTQARGTFYGESMGRVPPVAPLLVGGSVPPVGATQDRGAFYADSMSRMPAPAGPRPEPLGPALIPVAGAASPTTPATAGPQPAAAPAVASPSATTTAAPALQPPTAITPGASSLAARSAADDAETRAALDTSGIRPTYQGATADGTTRLNLPTAALGGGKAELSAPAGSAAGRRLEQMAGTRFAGGAAEYETDAQVAARRPDLYGPDGKPRQVDAFGNAVDPNLSAQVEQMKRITASIRELNGLPPEGQRLPAPQLGSGQADAMFARADDLTQQAAGIAGQPGDRRRREQLLQQASDLRASATRLAGLSLQAQTDAARNAVDVERNDIAREAARVRGDPRQQFLMVKGADGSEQAIDLRTMQPLTLPGVGAAAGGMGSGDRAFLNDIARFAKESVGGADQMEMDETTRTRYQTITGAAQQIYVANRGTPNAPVLTPSIAVQIAAGLADGSLRPQAYKSGDRVVRVVEFNGGVWPLDPIE